MFQIEALIEERGVLLALLLFNLAGSVAGFIFYLPQLAQSEPWAWIFIPDCPLASLLFTVFVALVLLKKRRGLVGALAFTTLIKYGFWTLLVLALYPVHYFGSDPFYFSAIALFHLLMIAEAWIVVHFQRFSLAEVLLSLLFLLANDASDYFFATMPIVPEAHLEAIRAVTFASTFLVCREALKFTKSRGHLRPLSHRIRL